MTIIVTIRMQEGDSVLEKSVHVVDAVDIEDAAAKASLALSRIDWSGKPIAE